jgi:hypothetical protein
MTSRPHLLKVPTPTNTAILRIKVPAHGPLRDTQVTFKHIAPAVPHGPGPRSPVSSSDGLCIQISCSQGSETREGGNEGAQVIKCTNQLTSSGGSLETDSQMEMCVGAVSRGAISGRAPVTEWGEKTGQREPLSCEAIITEVQLVLPARELGRAFKLVPSCTSNVQSLNMGPPQGLGTPMVEPPPSIWCTSREETVSIKQLQSPKAPQTSHVTCEGH